MTESVDLDVGPQRSRSCILIIDGFQRATGEGDADLTNGVVGTCHRASNKARQFQVAAEAYGSSLTWMAIWVEGAL